MMIDLNKALEFTKYFHSSNWDFHDSTEKGDIYISGNNKKTIDEIFHEWHQEYSFKDKLKHIIIPRVQELAKKEQEHLLELNFVNAPIEFIQTTEKYLEHYNQRIKEYFEYLEKLENE